MSGDASRDALAHELRTTDSRRTCTAPQTIYPQQQQQQQQLVNQDILHVRESIQSVSTSMPTPSRIAAIALDDAEREHTETGDGEEKRSVCAAAANTPAFEPMAMRRTVTMPLRIDTSVSARPSVHAGTRRHGTNTHSHSEATSAGVGAPPVWISPDWATYPIIEHFYGEPRRPRVSSFYEVMCSPTNLAPTTTLAANCCAYSTDDSASDGDAGGNDTGNTQRSKLGSFAYSCSTETSDDQLSSPLAAVTAADGDTAVSRPPRSGYAAWNRRHRTANDGHDLVPVPIGSSGASLQTPRRFGNPQAGSAESPSSHSNSSDDDRQHKPASPNAPTPTTSRLRSKLLDALAQVDMRIADERALLVQAQAAASELSTTLARPMPASGVWRLICGAQSVERGASADNATQLLASLRVALHTRAVNQLQRHRRHVHSILQIVVSHNPDLALTEQQLDSFETADAMLAHDVKVSVLQQQVAWLSTSLSHRPAALAHARARNGVDCFEHACVKSAMLAKLLEAVSWYRLVQTNAREQSVASAVGGLSTSTRPATDSVRQPADRAPTQSSLQAHQVDQILSVLAGEDFYADFSDDMSDPAWWAIAQAHFETLVFAAPEARVSQWMRRLATDVARVTREPLEDATGSCASAADKRSARRSTHQQQATRSTAPRIDWANDPQPAHLLEFVDRVTRRIRRDFDVKSDVTTSLRVLVERAVYPRAATLCFSNKATRESQRKDKRWRKRCAELQGVALERLGVPHILAAQLRSALPSRRVRTGAGSTGSRTKRMYLTRAVDAFRAMQSVVPCDLLDELLHGVVVLHHEAAVVLGTTQFSVETFFPLLAYALVHAALPQVHAQLHVLESFAITDANVNGEASYYVYCVHAAVEFVCNSAGLADDEVPLPVPASATAVSTTTTVSTTESTTAPESKGPAAMTTSATPTRAAELALTSSSE